MKDLLRNHTKAWTVGASAVLTLAMGAMANAASPAHHSRPVASSPSYPVASYPVASAPSRPLSYSLSLSQLRSEAAQLREGVSVTDRIRHDGDVVIYRIQGRSGRLQFNASGRGTNLACELYDESSSSGPIATAGGVSARDCRFDIQLVSARTYYVAIRGGTRTSVGEFTARYSIAASPISDSGHRNHAERLDRGRERQGTVAPREARWYEIRLSSDAELEVEVDATGSVLCEILDDRYRVITSERGSSARDCEIKFPASSGTYFVRVTSQEMSRYVDYEVEFDTRTVRDDHGNSRTQATRISRSRDVSGYLTRGDSDFFVIENLNGRTRIETSSAQRTDTLCILYDDRGREIARDDNSASNRQCKLDFHATGGRYYVEVKGASYSTSGPYTIRYH